MVYVVPTVFGVLQHATAALCTGKHITAVVGKVLECDGRLGGVVARALWMKLFKSGLHLPIWQVFSQRALGLHLIGGPSVFAHTFPALAVFQNAGAICRSAHRSAHKQAFEMIGIHHRWQFFSHLLASFMSLLKGKPINFESVAASNPSTMSTIDKPCGPQAKVAKSE